MNNKKTTKNEISFQSEIKKIKIKGNVMLETVTRSRIHT